MLWRNFNLFARSVDTSKLCIDVELKSLMCKLTVTVSVQIARYELEGDSDII